MPRSGRDQAPASYLASGSWPDGQLVDDAPASARYAEEISRRLRDTLHDSGLSISAFAAKAGAGRKAVERALRGETLPDIGTLARLEGTYQVTLWPDRPIGNS